MQTEAKVTTSVEVMVPPRWQTMECCPGRERAGTDGMTVDVTSLQLCFQLCCHLWSFVFTFGPLFSPLVFDMTFSPLFSTLDQAQFVRKGQVHILEMTLVSDCCVLINWVCTVGLFLNLHLQEDWKSNF